MVHAGFLTIEKLYKKTSPCAWDPLQRLPHAAHEGRMIDRPTAVMNCTETVENLALLTSPLERSQLLKHYYC